MMLTSFLKKFLAPSKVYDVLDRICRSEGKGVNQQNLKLLYISFLDIYCKLGHVITNTQTDWCVEIPERCAAFHQASHEVRTLLIKPSKLYSFVHDNFCNFCVGLSLCEEGNM